MLEEYIGIEGKALGYFAGVVGAAVVFVTLIYWAIFGFDRWSMEMQRASDLMAAAYVPAQLQQQPVGMGSPGQGGQFVCPQDGAVGLPRFDTAGVPHCPVCGQPMMFNGQVANTNAVLAVGGGMGGAP